MWTGVLLYRKLQYLYQKTAISFKCTFSGNKALREWLQKFNKKKRKRWLIDGTGILLHSKLKCIVWHVAVSFPMIAKNTRKKAALSKPTSLRVLLQGSCMDCCVPEMEILCLMEVLCDVLLHRGFATPSVTVICVMWHAAHGQEYLTTIHSDTSSFHARYSLSCYD